MTFVPFDFDLDGPFYAQFELEQLEKVARARARGQPLLEYPDDWAENWHHFLAAPERKRVAEARHVVEAFEARGWDIEEAALNSDPHIVGLVREIFVSVLVARAQRLEKRQQRQREGHR